MRKNCVKRGVTFRSSGGERSWERDKKSKEKELESHWRLQKPKHRFMFFFLLLLQLLMWLLMNGLVLCVPSPINNS